jgi:magnesium chelatase family protein
MLAKRLPTILPPLSFYEALEATKLYSIAGLLPSGQALLARRPFRSPHHSISDAGFINGGAVPRTGEVSLAAMVFSSQTLLADSAPLISPRQPLRRPFLSPTPAEPSSCGIHRDTCGTL